MAASIETVGAMLVRRGTILLGRRSPHARCCPDCWDVIGGHVDPGESLLAALTREVREEIGVGVHEPRAWTSLVYRDGDGAMARLTLFVVRRWDGEPAITNGEHVDLRWFDPDAAARLPQLALASYRPVFAAVMRAERAP